MWHGWRGPLRPRLSWIGMVLVTPISAGDRIGVDGALHPVLQQRRGSIKLDAADRTCHLLSWPRRAPLLSDDRRPARWTIPGCAPLPWGLAKIAEMDRAAFDADRLPLAAHPARREAVGRD